MASAVRCPVCSSDARPRLLERVGSYRLYACGVCDVTFSDPMEAPDSAWYDAAYLIRHIAVDDRIREYFRWALERLPSGCRILDVGCGEGTFVAYARRRGFDAWGIDFSRQAIEAGRRRYGLATLREGTLEDLRTDGEVPFEAVTTFEVLEHVESPVAFLQRLSGRLRPGGHLVLSVPNRDRWPIREFGDYPPNHLTRWSERSLRRVAREAGLTVMAVEQTSRLQSMNALFGHFPKTVLYWMVGLREEGLGQRSNVIGRMIRRSRFLGPVGTAMRRMRDLVVWIPALAAAPVLWRRCQGYNLIVHAQKPR